MRLKNNYKYLFPDICKLDAVRFARTFSFFSFKMQQVPDTDRLRIFERNVLGELLTVRLLIVGFSCDYV